MKITNKNISNEILDIINRYSQSIDCEDYESFQEDLRKFFAELYSLTELDICLYDNIKEATNNIMLLDQENEEDLLKHLNYDSYFLEFVLPCDHIYLLKNKTVLEFVF